MIPMVFFILHFSLCSIDFFFFRRSYSFRINQNSFKLIDHVLSWLFRSYKCTSRRRKNKLFGLFDEYGNWHEDDHGLEYVVTSYFQKMFSAISLDLEALEKTLGAIQPCVTDSMNQSLCAPYTFEEVRVALFQMYPTKSPGPDGMAPLFYQHYWESIGEEITKAVRIFFTLVSFSNKLISLIFVSFQKLTILRIWQI